MDLVAGEFWGRLDRLPALELASPEEPAHRPANFVSGDEALPVLLGRG